MNERPVDFKEHVFGDWSVRAACHDRVRLTRSSQCVTVRDTLTLDDVEELVRVLTGAAHDARLAAQIGKPYYGQALRLTVKAAVTVREIQRWTSKALASDVHFTIDNMLHALRTDGHCEETHRPNIERVMGWLAENPGHPFDVFICDAADMPEWEGFDGDEVGE